jgi:hypothetical protein
MKTNKPHNRLFGTQMHDAMSSALNSSDGAWLRKLMATKGKRKVLVSKKK